MQSPPRYVRSSPDGSVNLVGHSEVWETWQSASNPDGSWSLKSAHGGWLTAFANGTVHTAYNRDSPGEHFWLEP